MIDVILTLECRCGGDYECKVLADGFESIVLSVRDLGGEDTTCNNCGAIMRFPVLDDYEEVTIYN